MLGVFLQLLDQLRDRPFRLGDGPEYLCRCSPAVTAVRLQGVDRRLHRMGRVVGMDGNDTFAGVAFVLFGPQRVYASVEKTTELSHSMVNLPFKHPDMPPTSSFLPQGSPGRISRWRAWFRHLTRINCCSSSVRRQFCIWKISSSVRNCSSRRRPRFSVAWAPPSKRRFFGRPRRLVTAQRDGFFRVNSNVQCRVAAASLRIR